MIEQEGPGKDAENRKRLSSEDHISELRAELRGAIHATERRRIRREMEAAEALAWDRKDAAYEEAMAALPEESLYAGLF